MEKEGRRKRKERKKTNDGEDCYSRYNSPSKLNPCTIARVSVVRRGGGGDIHSLKGSVFLSDF